MATPSPKHLIESTEEVEAWFESKGLMDEEEPCTPEEAMSMRDFLVSADGRTNLTAQDTAIRLMTVPTNRDDMTDSGPKAFRIASLILDVQLQFEAQQILTLDLIDAINDMTEPGGLSASVKQRLHDISWECCTTAHSKWEELTSDAWRSAWAWRYEPIEDETEDDVINKWTAINALFANRCARSLEYTLSKKDESRISHTGLGDLGTIGLGQVVQSLEQEPWKRRPEKLPQGASDKKWKEFNIQNLDVELPSAVRWLVLTGRYLYLLIMQSLENAVELQALNPITDLWKVDESHPSGLTKLRWQFWKQRLHWIANDISDKDINPTTKTEANRAITAMEKFESQS